MLRHTGPFTVVLLLLAVLAFWPMYLSKSWAEIDRYTHAHALLGTLWFFVLLAQPILINRGSRLAHRMVGRTSLLIALGFVLSSILLAHFRVSRMTEAAFAKEGMHIYLPLAIAALFGTACVFGMRWRKSAAVHGRFMFSTALMLVDPLLARIMFFYLPRLPSDHLYQGISFAVVAAVMVYLVISLPPSTPGRSWYRNYCLGAVAILALYFSVPYTDAWLAFSNWFRVLPLT